MESQYLDQLLKFSKKIRSVYLGVNLVKTFFLDHEHSSLTLGTKLLNLMIEVPITQQYIFKRVLSNFNILSFYVFL